jgi:hypothetical protein
MRFDTSLLIRSALAEVAPPLVDMHAIRGRADRFDIRAHRRRVLALTAAVVSTLCLALAIGTHPMSPTGRGAPPVVASTPAPTIT